MTEPLLTLHGDPRLVERVRAILEQEGIPVDEAATVETTDDLAVAEESAAAREIDDLKQAIRELRNLDVAKSQFLANVSHELRTPLTAIVTYGEVLRDGLLGDLNERQREAIHSVIGSSRQLLSMIEEILTYARTSARAIELAPTDFEISDVIRAVHEMSASLMRKKGLRFETEIEASLPAAYADRDKVLHVLSNLIGNAIEFTPPAGLIRIVARRSTRRDAFLEVVVEDNGIGIDSEHHDMIFREFAQVDSSRARQYHGTGLGLAIARNFILLHGGEIGVDSQLGQGSRFFFTVPSVEARRGER